MNIGRGTLNLDAYFAVAVDSLQYRHLRCREATGRTRDRPPNQCISAAGDRAALGPSSFEVYLQQKKAKSWRFQLPITYYQLPSSEFSQAALRIGEQL